MSNEPAVVTPEKTIAAPISPPPVVSTLLPSNGTPLKTSNSPAKNPGIKLPSIADIKSGKFELKKEEKKDEEILPTNEFSYGDFKHYWDEAIAQVAAKNQTSTNVMISHLQPELKEDKIHLVFNNKVQLELFQSEKPFIAGYLSSLLR
jgi:hypothetical protein